MQAVMVVYMDITDPSWTTEYFKTVPGLLAEYGAVSVAGSRRITRLEGSEKEPERMAIISFPSMDAIHAFWKDERYQPFKQARENGSNSRIFVFENAVSKAQLV